MNQINDLLNKSSSYKKTSENYPMILEERIQRAVMLKRQGRYKKAIKVYMDIFNEYKTIYSALILYLYKVVAPAGYISTGEKLLELGLSIYKYSTTYSYVNGFSDHLLRLKESSNSEFSLKSYLQSISGNPNYSMPFDFHTMLKQ